MPEIPKALVAMAQVANVNRSIEFYKTFGFGIDHTHTPEGQAEPIWAHLQSANAHLMLAKASKPVDASQQAVLFYVYFDDVKAKHAELIESGIEVGELCFPFFCPQGQFRVTDPDGYTLMCTHV